MTPAAVLDWVEQEQQRSVRWRSESGSVPPRRVQLADDTMTADGAFRLASEGTGLLWRGDFQNARQLLQALARRADRKPRKTGKPEAVEAGAAFHRHRMQQGQRARILAMLLIELEGDYAVKLRRAPDLRLACSQAWGPADGQASVASLRELLGLVGAHEWRKKGVEIAALGPPPANRIHAHYGVFSPVRGEYIELVANAPLPATGLAFDIGTGTGVLAAVLAQRGVQRVVATDQDPRALACARDNVSRLGLEGRIEVLQADLFPPGQAALVVCNPPWVPGRPSSPIEHAVYDDDSRMLRGFLAGLPAHLAPRGEGWLILSDLAEHLGLRSREQLLEWIDSAGLKVLARSEARPRHPKATDPDDPLHAARSREVTALWRLALRDEAGARPTPPGAGGC